MKTKGRLLSLILAFFMLASMLSVLPPLEVSAAEGDTPEVELLTPSLNGNQFTMRAEMTLSGGAVECYGFAYSINGSQTQYALTYKSIGKWVEFSHTITVNPGDVIWYEAIVRNQYGLEGKVGANFVVPQQEPEIELDPPQISSPDEDDTFYAGEDITFKWGSVSDAEGFEWGLYETCSSYIEKLVDEGTIVGTSLSKRQVKIDGDTFKVGNAYKFKVRAYCDGGTSDWDSISIFVSESHVFYVDDECVSIDSQGGSQSVNLTSNVAWSATVSSDWIDIDKTSGTGNAEIRIDVEENTGDFRVGVIEINSEVAGKITIEIQQKKGTPSTLEINPTTLTVTSEEQYYSFFVSSNVTGWRATSNADWIRSVSSSSFNFDDTIRFSVDENKSTESRTGTITVTGDGITRTVTVTQEGKPHECAFGEWEAVDAESHKRVCACGEEETESHSYDEGVVTSEPEHEIPGERTFTCTECEYSYTEEIAAEEHAFGEWEAVDAESHKRVCACGEEETESHSYDEGIVTIEPGHEIPGERTFTCTECGYSYTEEIAAEEHAFGEWEAVDAESHKRVCACGEEETESHSYDEGVVTSEPGHEIPGERTFTCTECGYSYTEEIAAEEHAFGEWETVDAENHKRVCACGEEENEEHKWDNGSTVNINEIVYICQDCNEQKIVKSETDHISGDIDGDGEFSIEDANIFMRYIAKQDVDVNELALDINGDGKINNKDVIRLMQYQAGWDVEIL